MRAEHEVRAQGHALSRDGLTTSQVATYQDQGFLTLPGLFSEREVEALLGELPALFSEDSPRRVLEKDGTTVRSIYGAHEQSARFQQLVHDPRLVEPARQLLESEVYLYQFKINAKLGMAGDVWAWHQDFIFWCKEDGTPEPRLVNAALFLDEVNEFNGPLIFIPRSHREGMIDLRPAGVPPGYEEDPDWIANLTADLKYTLDKPTISRLAQREGLVAPKGPRGTIVLFHPNLCHASAPNLSPFDRVVSLATYNSVHNTPRPVAQPRPDFLCATDTAPIEAIPSLLGFSKGRG